MVFVCFAFWVWVTLHCNLWIVVLPEDRTYSRPLSPKVSFLLWRFAQTGGSRTYSRPLSPKVTSFITTSFNSESAFGCPTTIPYCSRIFCIDPRSSHPSIVCHTGTCRSSVLARRASQFTSVAKVPNTGEGDSSQPYDVMYTFFCVYLLMFCDVTYIFTYTFLCLFTYVLWRHIYFHLYFSVFILHVFYDVICLCFCDVTYIFTYLCFCDVTYIFTYTFLCLFTYVLWRHIYFYLYFSVFLCLCFCDAFLLYFSPFLLYFSPFLPFFRYTFHLSFPYKFVLFIQKTTQKRQWEPIYLTKFHFFNTLLV